jgi:hypothetical protein
LPDGEKMGKGVTLSKEELLALKELLELFPNDNQSPVRATHQGYCALRLA